jgi:hypothetical protein
MKEYLYLKKGRCVVACMDHECIGDAELGLKPCGWATGNNEIIGRCPNCGGDVSSIFDEPPEDVSYSWAMPDGGLISEDEGCDE